MTVANAEQIRIWNEVNAERWLRLREPMTRPLAPFGEVAMRALAPRAGESALDVGCGCGDTTVALARITGNALGIDVCEPFLRVAREEAVPGARYLLADAQSHRFEERFDLCFSRFGVMFFEDPGAAFANLRSALRPGGRFAAIVWGPWQENDWVSIPLRVLGRSLPVSDPAPGPGPFGLSDRDALAQRLIGADFAQVSVTSVELPFEATASHLLQTGPASAALRQAGELGERLRPQVQSELAAELPPRLRALALLATAVA